MRVATTAICLSLLALTIPARATTMVALSTDDLFHRADVVAVAHVQTIQSFRAGGRIVTEVSLTVTQPFKGAAERAPLTVLVAGGTDGRWGQRVDGMPRFEPGEDCVVFLHAVSAGKYHVVGLEQGHVRLETDAGQLRLHRTQTAQLLKVAPGGGWEEAAPQPESEPAAPFLAHLRQLAGGAP